MHLRAQRPVLATHPGQPLIRDPLGLNTRVRGLVRRVVIPHGRLHRRRKHLRVLRAREQRPPQTGQPRTEVGASRGGHVPGVPSRSLHRRWNARRRRPRRRRPARLGQAINIGPQHDHRHQGHDHHHDTDTHVGQPLRRPRQPAQPATPISPAPASKHLFLLLNALVLSNFSHSIQRSRVVS